MKARERGFRPVLKQQADFRAFVAGYLKTLPIRTPDAVIDRRFIAYLLELTDGVDRKGFPPMNVFADVFGDVAITNVPIPSECTDGFLGAYLRRPDAYLDPTVRASIFTFVKLADVDAGLATLREDLRNGVWDRKYRSLRQQDDLDLGYRLVVAQVTSNTSE